MTEQQFNQIVSSAMGNLRKALRERPDLAPKVVSAFQEACSVGMDERIERLQERTKGIGGVHQVKIKVAGHE